MANFSQTLQTSVAFFHSKSKVLTEKNQNVYEASFASNHSVRNVDVWQDNINYAINAGAADAEAVGNSAVTKHTLQPMTEIGGSNQQAYRLEVLGNVIRPWISPTDIPSTANMPSYGYQMNLYQADNTLITPTEGRWISDYAAGIVQFEEGYDPITMGWGNIKCTVYAYSGTFTGTGGTGVEILYGEGPPFYVIPTGSPQFFLDMRDYTGNPFNYILWGYGNAETRHEGWRPLVEKWESFYIKNEVPMTELYYYDFIKGNPETAPITEVIEKGFTRLVDPHIAPITEVVAPAPTKYNLETVEVSEVLHFTLTPGPSAIVNESAINDYALGG